MVKLSGGGKMEKEKKALLEQQLYEQWEERWSSKGYFDPENPTLEQSNDQWAEYKKVFPVE
jgi:hypothetical protein